MSFRFDKQHFVREFGKYKRKYLIDVEMGDIANIDGKRVAKKYLGAFMCG